MSISARDQRLAAILRAKGVLTGSQVEQALSEMAKANSSMSLTSFAVARRWCTETQVQKAMADYDDAPELRDKAHSAIIAEGMATADEFARVVQELRTEIAALQVKNAVLREENERLQIAKRSDK